MAVEDSWSPEFLEVRESLIRPTGDDASGQFLRLYADEIATELMRQLPDQSNGETDAEDAFDRCVETYEGMAKRMTAEMTARDRETEKASGSTGDEPLWEAYCGYGIGCKTDRREVQRQKEHRFANRYNDATPAQVAGMVRRVVNNHYFFSNSDEGGVDFQSDEFRDWRNSQLMEVAGILWKSGVCRSNHRPQGHTRSKGEVRRYMSELNGLAREYERAGMEAEALLLRDVVGLVDCANGRRRYHRSGMPRVTYFTPFETDESPASEGEGQEKQQAGKRYESGSRLSSWGHQAGMPAQGRNGNQQGHYSGQDGCYLRDCSPRSPVFVEGGWGPPIRHARISPGY